MTNPTSLSIVVPSRLQVGEPFTIKVRVLGPIHPIPCAGNFNDVKPRLRGPFNLNVSRQIQFHDNTLPEWQGCLAVDGEGALSSPVWGDERRRH